MKINKQYLQQVIKEELEKTLNEKAALESRKSAVLKEIESIHKLDEAFGDTIRSFVGQKFGVGPTWAKRGFKSEKEFQEKMRAEEAARKAAADAEWAAYQEEQARINREIDAKRDAEARAAAARLRAGARAYDEEEERKRRTAMWDDTQTGMGGVSRAKMGL